MNSYNPDVLLCLANLSNDEVFTPHQLANEVLDLLPKEIWKDKNAKFLDPCCKTGVFLREITIRLIEGLKDKIPDLQERVNHILTNQVYGIAITELTALTTRRTLYCSKEANGKFSICTTFGHPEGNVYYRRIEHDWKKGICSFCGASQKEFDRSVELETYAYAFIHKPMEELFNMKFDVIIGNPPYQLSDGSGGNGSSAVPIYHKFVQKAKELNPKYISMIIPSRWFSGGRGLDSFRSEMLNDNRISSLIDYPIASNCFPGVEIKGGVCYFLWDKNYQGDCEITTILNNEKTTCTRPLLEEGLDTFIRSQQGVKILRKVQDKNEQSFSTLVSSSNPFGFRSYFKGESTWNQQSSIKLYGNKSITYINSNIIRKNSELVNDYKILISKAYGAGETFPHQIIGIPFISEPKSICTETYLVIRGGSDLKEVENILSYMKTKFFRFMVFLKKQTQNTTANTYSLVPIQDFSKTWTDEELYKKYSLTSDEIDYIESMIRPMGISKIKEV